LARIGPRKLRVVLVAFEDEIEDEFRKALAQMCRRVNANLLEVMPVVVLDSMLPGQHLTFTTDRLPVAAPDCDRFLMVGMRPGPALLQVGVEARVLSRTVRGPSRTEVEVVGCRLVGMPGHPMRSESRDGAGRPHFSASVDWATAEEEREALEGHGGATLHDPDLVRKSTSLEPMVDRWLHLVRTGGHERQEGQLDLVLGHLGPMPPAKEVTARALWVAALINPLPSLGVAWEIRPSMLLAASSRERLEVCLRGLHDSIAHLDGSAPMR